MIEEGLETMYQKVMEQTKAKLLLQTTVTRIDHVKGILRNCTLIFQMGIGFSTKW